jgi:hypothetical protein
MRRLQSFADWPVLFYPANYRKEEGHGLCFEQEWPPADAVFFAEGKDALIGGQGNRG